MNIPIQLKQAIQDNKLILFVGSGLSKRFGFPDWEKLVIEILNKIEEKKYLPFLEDKSWPPVKVLGEIEKDYKDIITQHLVDTFSQLPPDADLSFHKKLLELSSKIITTNYDKAFEKTDETLPVAHNFDVFHASQLGRDRFYLKLHGCVSSPANCILFPSQYDKFYKGGENATIFKFKNLINDNTCLFLGFSLSDPEINLLFQQIEALFEGFSSKHFICSTEDFSSKFSFVKNFPIPKLQNHDELNSIIDELITFKKQENSLVPTTTQPLSQPLKNFGLETIIKQADSLDEMTDEDRKLFYASKVALYEQTFAEVDAKYQKFFAYDMFERIATHTPLTQEEMQKIRAMAKNDDFTWYEKNLIVSALAVSVMARFERSRLEILLDFVLANEEKVWQTAFIGLVLGINGRENKLTFAENQTLAQHLNELLEIERIQKALIDTTEILREKSFVNDIVKGKLFAQHYPKYDFFKKIEHWFLPFYQGHQVVQDLKNGDTQQPIDQEWLNLLENTRSLCDPDKYALCLHIDNYSVSQITGLKEILQKERRELNLNTDYKDSMIIKKELSKFYQFYSTFSSEKLMVIAKGQEQLQATALPRMLMSELTKLRIQADEYYSINNYAQAIPLYEAYLKYATNDNQAWFNIAYAYSGKGEKDKTIECYEKAVGIKPDYHEAWNNMANAYSAKGEKDKAIECYEKTIKIKPDSHETWYNMGIVYSAKGENDKAIKYYTKAVEIKPDYHEAWNNIGNAYFGKSENDKAIECYEKAIEIKPDYHEAWNNIGNAYFGKGENDRAIECYEKAVEIKPNKHEAWNNIGNAYSTKGEKGKAIKCHEKAIEIKPDYHEAWMSLGFLYLKLGALVLAQEKMEEAIKLGSIDFGNMNMGHICLAQNKEEKALLHYEIALQNFSAKENFFEGMADDFQYLEQYGISVAYYESIIEQLKQP